MTIRENGDDCSTVGIVLYQTQIKIIALLLKGAFKLMLRALYLIG